MKRDTIAIIILCIAVISLAYYGLVFKADKTELNKEIRQLQRKNDSLNRSNELLDSLINIQINIADSLSKEIVNTNRVINKLKNVRYEKIRAIDSMDNNKLLEFFAGFESTGTDN